MANEVEKVSQTELEKLKKDASTGRKGQWVAVCSEVLKDGQPRHISGISRGQAWGIKRTAETKGLVVTILKGDKGMLIERKPKD